jgi:CheY-like chemotaxis protein
MKLAVTDTGEGLNAESIAKLFTPFQRLHNGGGVEGTGLGLALSRSLVEAMGGTLECTSIPGEGSTFTIELGRGEPTAVAAPRADERELIAEHGYDGERRLLYVEDTVANVRLVEDILESRPDVRILPAAKGTLGLELAREHDPDLILLDLHLPDLGGREVLAELRADERTRDIPVVVLSAEATKRAPRAMLEAGAQAYLTKPVGVRDLLEVVDRYLGTG